MFTWNIYIKKLTGSANHKFEKFFLDYYWICFDYNSFLGGQQATDSKMTKKVQIVRPIGLPNS